MPFDAGEAERRHGEDGGGRGLHSVNCKGCYFLHMHTKMSQNIKQNKINRNPERIGKYFFFHRKTPSSIIVVSILVNMNIKRPDSMNNSSHHE